MLGYSPSPLDGGFYAHYPFAYAGPPSPLPHQAEEVRTVFITGFPEDVRERELNNMLRFLPGYEASQMHFRGGQAQGFALFSQGSLARAAVDAIQSLVFDNESVLRAEMAHKNMYLKDDPAAVLPGKRAAAPRFEVPPAAYGYAPPPGSMPPPLPHGYHPPPGGSAYGALPSSGAGAPPPPPGAIVPPVQPRGYAPITNTKDNPPCNTLFIGNLGDGVSDAELRGLFTHQPGFQQLKLVRSPKGMSCFIEFVDTPSATAVHDAQQGAILASSDRGGIRIQYSKNPFGRKREASAEAAAAAMAAACISAPPPAAPAGQELHAASHSREASPSSSPPG